MDDLGRLPVYRVGFNEGLSQFVGLLGSAQKGSWAGEKNKL